ncbi:flagella basal body P-ring formation protein FlgA [Allosphingosinicella flava]|uniref:Flagella basal body P-ring formation protein FlgA n=1 Tax=Allosphingosinicella flava TaxID=2771430 RepID=A0A7T2GK48_9SPHN|nr:flagella basal body P-ring formation protein FlgA [Sphingosinicella flava]QPQ55341.1 flagella basal body P-ring formation protein FlgA [Sphingosinicella flava]
MTLFRRTILLAACLAAPAWGQGFEDLDALDARVIAALGAGIGEAGGPARPLDRRLKLAACPAPVTVDAPALGAATLRCEPLGWRIRVPVIVSAAASMGTVKADPIVRKGDQVEITVRGAAFTVSTLGVAEQDGAPGDRIRIRSERKAGPIIGEVTADGRVALAGFK